MRDIETQRHRDTERRHVSFMSLVSLCLISHDMTHERETREIRETERQRDGDKGTKEHTDLDTQRDTQT